MGMLEESFEGAFAMLDVLGFSARMKAATTRQQLEALRDSIIGGLLTAVEHAESRLAHDKRKSAFRAPLGASYFSDTLVFWLPTERNKPEVTMTSMLFACQIVIAEAMWMGIPLRGAVAYGDCIVSRDPVYYLGAPILEAHDLEARQAWAGAALCDSAAVKTRREEVGLSVVEWQVPMKARNGDIVDEKRLVVDWPAASPGPRFKRWDPGSSTDVEDPPPNWAACFPGIDPTVERKREATSAFFDSRNRAATNARYVCDALVSNSIVGWRERYEGR
jgi:hypothetical protein